MLEWLLLVPLALIGLTVLAVFILAASVIGFLIELPFKLLGWLLGAVCFAVFIAPLVLLLAFGAFAAILVLLLPVLPLVFFGGLVWLAVRLVRRGRAATVR